MPSLIWWPQANLSTSTMFSQRKNICTQHLPRAIPVYNVDRTLYEAGYITEAVDIMVQCEGHSEHATFHINGFG